MKRAVLLGLTLVMILFLYCAFASAEDGLCSLSIKDKCLGIELLKDENSDSIRNRSSTNWNSILSVSTATLRSGLLNRQSSITVRINEGPDYFGGDLENLAFLFIEEAVKYTNNPKEGDYLAYHITHWSANMEYNTTYINITYNVTYSTTIEQEIFVDSAIENILADLNLQNKSDIGRIKAIYDWICKNIHYSMEGAHNTTYKALSTNSCACQGYALLLYRLLNQAGIECHILDGYGANVELFGGTANHCWNIIKVYDLFYLADATWDQSSSSYSWFLHGSNDWENHYYLTTEYLKYNISTTNYEIVGQADIRLLTHLNTEISELQYTFGSFSWDGDEDNANSLEMEISIPQSDEVYIIQSATVTLPDGFSFEEYSLKSQQTVIFDQAYQGILVAKVTIFPIYSNEYKASYKVNIEMNGINQYVGSIRAKENTASGLVRMRPTTGVNNSYTSPFWLQVNYSPYSDFFGSTSSYSQNLSQIGCVLSQSVYNTNYHENSTTNYTYSSFRNLGFSRIVWQLSEDNHDVAVGYALKKIIKDNEIYNVVLVVVRGTVGTEWIGNFNIGGLDDSTHADFQRCANKVKTRLQGYLNALNIPSNNLKIFLCGHSRGGATVDLAAHDLNNEYGNGKIFAYTFAAPNSTKNPVADSNIFNYGLIPRTRG